jgi:hypothetical protein
MANGKSTGYANRMAALQRPEIRKKVSEGVKKWRDSQTSEERKAHNAKIAASYRRTVGKRLLENPSLKYGVRAPIKLWMEGKIKTLEETR